MQTFFVFNTSFSKSEENDPKDALVYFYPLEICDDQKCELCFQLVGISHFLQSTFTSPVVVSLDKGTFAFCRSQNYLFVLGSGRAVSSTILKENLQFLYRAFAFYWKDINLVLMMCHNDRLLFLQKMKEIWDRILLTSGFFGSMTCAASSIIPVKSFSQKNSSDIHSRAKYLLHMCQRNSPVIAGAIFCDKLLIYTQLIPGVTRNLVLLLNFKDHDILHNAQIACELPPGVKMKKIYLTQKEISSIMKFNHMNVGSQIRYQSYKKMSISQCGAVSLSSGSEGDVDSENSSGDVEADKSLSSVSDARSQPKPSEHSLVCTSAVLETPPHLSSVHLNKVLERNISTDTERNISASAERSFSTDTERSSISADTERSSISADTERSSICADTERRNISASTERRSIHADTKRRSISASTERSISVNTERSISVDTERSWSSACDETAFEIQCYKIYSQYINFTDGGLWRQPAALQRRHSFSCASNSQSATTNSCCDGDCYVHTGLLKIFECTEKFDLSVSRKWSFEGLPCFNRRTLRKLCNLLTASCYLCLIRNHIFANELLQSNVTKKLQILKCRLNKHRNRNHNSSMQPSKCIRNGSSPQRVSNSHRGTAIEATGRKKNSFSVESIQDSSLTNNCERQEMFLYIQKYGSCILFLLLNNSFDEDLLHDLWMHGFSNLGEIELQSKRSVLSASIRRKTDFQIYVYDSVHHKLSGKIPNASPSANININDTALQMMHVDLQSNTSLCSVSVISQNRSLIGCHASQNEAYYVQPGTVNVSNEMSTRRESFTHFYRKAKHRIKKHCGIEI